MHNGALDVTLEGRVLRLALNRPDKRNALSAELCTAIVEAVEGAENNPDVRAILLEARGQVFSAGMDLSEALGEHAADRTSIHERLFTLGSRTRKPIVAAVSGPALGGGVGLIANAHIAIAAQGCTFGLTEIRVGMWPFVIWRAVAAAIGERRTRALALTGRIFGTNEAVQWGLLTEVVPAFEVDDRATATATHLAESSPQAIRLGLEYLRESRNLNPADSGVLALEFRRRAFESADYREGVSAFLEKRKPSW